MNLRRRGGSSLKAFAQSHDTTATIQALLRLNIYFEDTFVFKFSVIIENSENTFYLYLMKLIEAKQKFIQQWGVFASRWGINRTMAQVHALLLISEKPLSTDDVMNELSISRGNANMNIRELMNWELVHKAIVQGDRKEYFSAEKDIWKVATRIMQQRKKRELDPMVRLLDELSKVEGDKRNAEIKSFTDTVNNITKFSVHAEKVMDVMIKAEENWFWGSFLKVIK